MYRPSRSTVQIQFLIYLLIFALISAHILFVAGLDENDSCRNINIAGICLPYSQCQNLKAYIKAGVLLQEDVTSCTYTVYEEVICCPLETYEPNKFSATSPIVLDNDSTENTDHLINFLNSLAHPKRTGHKAESHTEAAETADNLFSNSWSNNHEARFPPRNQPQQHNTDRNYANAYGTHNAKDQHTSYGYNAYDTYVPSFDSTHSTPKNYTTISIFNTQQEFIKVIPNNTTTTERSNQPQLSIFNTKREYLQVRNTNKSAENAVSKVVRSVDNATHKNALNFNDSIFKTDKDFVVHIKSSPNTQPTAATSHDIFQTGHDFLNVCSNNSVGQNSNQNQNSTNENKPKNTQNVIKSNNDFQIYYPSERQNDLNVGDSCTAQRYVGICMEQTRCWTADKWIRSGHLLKEDITTCGLGFFEERICCPNENPIEPRAFFMKKENETTTTSTPTTRKSIQLDLSTITEKASLTDGTLVLRYPHMAAIGYLKKNFQSIEYRCAGVLITKSYVLVPSNCIKGNETTDRPLMMRFRVAEIDPDDFDEEDEENDESLGKSITIKRSHLIADSDFGILELLNPEKYEKYIDPVSICKQDTFEKLMNNAKITATGWANADSKTITCPLSETLLRPQFLPACFKAYGNYLISGNENLQNMHVCYGALSGVAISNSKSSKTEGVDNNDNFCNEPCLVGVGSALHFWTSSNNYCLAGIATPTRSCDATGPALFSKIFRYIDAIQSIVGSQLLVV